MMLPGTCLRGWVMTTEKEKALELAIGQIERQFGKGSIMRLGQSTVRMVVEAIPTWLWGWVVSLEGGLPKFLARSPQGNLPWGSIY